MQKEILENLAVCMNRLVEIGEMPEGVRDELLELAKRDPEVVQAGMLAQCVRRLEGAIVLMDRARDLLFTRAMADEVVWGHLGEVANLFFVGRDDGNWQEQE